MHIPQSVALIPIFKALSLAAFLQSNGLKNSSLSVLTFQFIPFTAFPGQASKQFMQLLHFDSVIDFPTFNFAFVNTDVNLIADPNSSVTSMAHLPIQPIPD